ncbi:FAD/NAD(P)-binding domain-containing protein [Choiromyces venosus 120613-1]|uniref:FAD/NAD(P)-binding domain-containing protein n=1 Tax=Choiromyces venosus 120613-1 TaxID=1336337 RepID=A0A3N4K7D3_9PEZI|nr:FAD/NAD(P)-binding domain-containing protein [Choiromyces venosus 120613-1]
MSRKKIIIIGAGITGPTLALTILKNPALKLMYEPILLDRQTRDTYAQGAGVVLSSNALHPLINLGLKDGLWEISQEVVEMSIYRDKRYLNSMVTPNWSPDIGGGTGLRVVERGALMKLLVDEVCAKGGEVQWGAKVVDLVARGDGVEVVIEGDASVFGDLAVGADGIWSVVRKSIIGEGWKPAFMNSSGIYGIYTPKEKTESSQGYIVLLDVAGLSTWPLPGGKYFWTITVPEATPPTSKSTTEKIAEYPNATIITGGYPLSSTLDILSRLSTTSHPSLPGGVCAELCQRSSRIVRAPLYQLVFESTQIVNATSNIVLTGDAARVMLPTSGQGACMGIEDATVLANSLLNNSSIRGALAEYANSRVPRSKSIASQAYWSGVVFMANRWVVRVARDWLMGILPKGRDAKE